MIASRFKNFIFRILQQPFLQGLYEIVHLLFLRAMNFGGGADLINSGEKKALEFAAEKLLGNKEIVILDAGANLGEFSRLAHQIFTKPGINLKIFAFEPLTPTFGALKNNLQAFGNISLIKQALGERAGQVSLYGVKNESGLTSVYKRNLEFAGKQTELAETVAMTTLDEFCSANSIQTVDYLKLDVEGHELFVLKGASNLIANGKIRFLQFEFGGANIDSKTYFKDFYYLLSPKYNLYRILSTGLWPLREYKEIYEVFLTSNYLAVLK